MKRTCTATSGSHQRAYAVSSRADWCVRLSFTLLFLFTFLLPPSFASADGAASVEIGPPDATAFPLVSTVLDVYDSSGQFVSGLKPTDITIREDETAQPVQKLTEFPVGAQIVVAFNTGSGLGVRDGSGVTRYEKIQRALGAWARALQPETGDDLSLVSIAGLINAHSGPSEFDAALAAFQPDFRTSTANIQSLSVAVESALGATPKVGMKRAVLYVTTHMEDPSLESALTDIGRRAVEGHVRIFIWFADSQLYFDDPSAALFQTLATQTGGDFALFDTGKLPDPETYFAPLRNAYRLTYLSSLNTTGDHHVSAEVNIDGQRVASAAQTFSLNIQPPNPILTPLPEQITRRAPADDPYNTEILEPNEQSVEVIFDFPDGHQRAVVSVTLFVDGQAVATNESGALDKFTWDLSGYTESAEHKLRVEATDNLGLTGSSIEIPVSVQVVRTAATPLVLLTRYRYVLVGSVVAVAGLILLGVLLSGRLRIRSAGSRREQKKRYTDPLTQPVAIAAAESKTGPRKASRATKTIPIADAPAALLRLGPDGEPLPGASIPVPGVELLIGADASQATFVLNEPAISPLHAWIRQTEGGYTISDPGSVAGTWVNYDLVSREGHPLKHGDRVHLGHLMYRFVLKNPPPTSEPKITPLDP